MSSLGGDSRCARGRQAGERRFPADQRRQLFQRAPVDTTLEEHHLAQGLPVLDPPPAVELGSLRPAQADVRLVTHKSQDVPALLLTDAEWPPVAADEALREAVPEPSAGAADNLHVGRAEPHLFVELPEHGLLRRLVPADPALGKLPGILAHPAGPQQLPGRVGQNDPDVGPETVRVDHGLMGLSALVGFLHKHEGTANALPGAPEPTRQGPQRCAQGVNLKLAIFDLDNTLIAGDSDYLWGQFLAELGVVDAEAYVREHDRYYADYLAGALDIHEFLRFQLEPLTRFPMGDLLAWRGRFMQEKIRPILLPRAVALIAEHRQAQHTLLIITATNRFITEPIASVLGVEHLIATEPATDGGRFTGEVAGTPSYASGKVTRLENWLTQQLERPAETWFYSDSHNDLPLLERVDHPVAVDPDDTLGEVARSRAWPIISLRNRQKHRN